LAWSLIVIFFIDLEHQIIPDEIVFPNIFLFLIFHLVTNHPAFAKASAGRQLLITNYLLSALLSSLFLYLIYLITRGKGMGIGDVKLAFLMGLSLGYPKTIVAMYASFLTGAFLGLILVLVKKVKFGQKIPFGPFLSWGTIVAYIWGGKILDISQKIFF